MSADIFLAILECGVERWNVFRREHPKCLVLSGVSMPDAQLARADLQGAILTESHLLRANLAFAHLEKAVLRKTDLSGSDLRHANLDRADLFRANLSGADLREASLCSSFLKCADLRGADLSTARGLTESQIGEAFGDQRTRLPEGIRMPANWTA